MDQFMTFRKRIYICSTGHKDCWYLKSELSEVALGEARTRIWFSNQEAASSSLTLRRP